MWSRFVVVLFCCFKLTQRYIKISKKQDKDSYRIIEINTVPGVHMHYAPAIGKSRNIASYMVDLIYPETKVLEKSDNNGYQKSIRKI